MKLLSLGDLFDLTLPDSPSLHDLDWSNHCSPTDVVVPPLQKREPPFVTSEWLHAIVDIVKERCKASDSASLLVPPMALVRCSRGGKTRALQEIARQLKADLPGSSVVYVTFNDSSSLQSWEQDDPLGALCRRIAFASLRERDYEKSDRQYEAFASARVSADEIGDWLGENTPCILLVDELNLLVELNKTDSRVAKNFALFLKSCFLITENRYFIFSSHVASTVRLLMDLMEAGSSRQVDIQELPLIPTLAIARENLLTPLLSAREAVYFALVPSLIFVSTVELGLPVSKQIVRLVSVAKELSHNAERDEFAGEFRGWPS
jgi:hypothetical protein